MANTKQAKKRALQADNRRDHNASLRSTVRTYIKKVVLAIESGNKEVAQAAFTAAVPVIDRIADKDQSHQYKGARHKSRLSAQTKAIALSFNALNVLSKRSASRGVFVSGGCCSCSVLLLLFNQASSNWPMLSNTSVQASTTRIPACSSVFCIA